MEREIIDAFLREELRVANRHIPSKRISICELINMEVPYVITSAGDLHVFDYREINLISTLSNNNCELKLPILVEFVPEGEGIYVVRNPLEAKIVAKVLGLERSSAPLILYRPSVFELRRKLRTTSTILLSPSIINKEV
ncbi:MAG: DUF61 family protein [Desulfurococcaceae archaeon]